MQHGLFPAEFKDVSHHARTVRLGLLAGRYLDQQFVIPDGRSAVFQRSTERKGNVYRVSIRNAE